MAAGSILAIGGMVSVGLLLLAPWHGFHRDELYFIVAGRHPAFGYPDQPPLTPLLSAFGTLVLGVQPLAVRVLPAVAVGATVALVGLMAREMGGARTAQVLAAITAGLSGFLAAGHLGSTTTYELLLWTIVMWLVIRLLDGADAWEWLVVGAFAGVALQNKQTALLLGAGLLGGIVLARRRDVLRSPMPWLGGLLALLIWAPNLAWQAANGFPQLAMASGIASEATEHRLMLVPELLLLAGPLLFPIAVVGLVWLIRADEAGPWRAVPAAFGVVLLLVFLSGGKSYYAVGMLGPLMAAGAIPVAAWLEHGHERIKGVTLAAAAVVSGVLIAVIALPVIPPATLADTPIPDIYPETAEQVGWPMLVAAVDGAVATFDAEEVPATAILTANYGEAGAIESLGQALPPVYSGHVGYWDWGPPPEDAVNTVVVGIRLSPELASALGRCTLLGLVDNGFGLTNQEQGAPIWVCRAREEAWASLWPRLRHLD